jgi:hypothetical protein
VRIIQCERCEKYIRAKHGHDERNIPDEWITLSQHGQDDKHFCSLQCLQQAINGVIGLPVNMPHEPYPSCCSKHYPIPERKSRERRP